MLRPLRETRENLAPKASEASEAQSTLPQKAVAENRNRHDTEEIQHQPFPNHAIDGKLTRPVDDRIWGSGDG